VAAWETGMGRAGDIRMNWPIVVCPVSLSVAAFLQRGGGSMLTRTGNHGRGVERRVPKTRLMVEFNRTSANTGALVTMGPFKNYITHQGGRG